MIYNIFIALSIFLLVLISALTMYLPLRALVKDKLISLKYAIPFSISLEIIIGYIFYCTSTVKYFPVFYLVFALLANIWAFFKLKPITFKKININWMVIIALSLALVALIYTRYYDSFKFIGPGGSDTYNHLIFVKDLINKGYLHNGYYAPGFHLFLMPIAKLIPLTDLYRFAGPAIGIVSVIVFVLFIRDSLKNKILIIFLLALLALPVYNQLTLQTISFFSSVLTFIFFASFIFLSVDQDIKQRKINLGLFLVFAVALALTVPYLFVTIIPAFLIIFGLVLIFKKNFVQGYSRYLLTINLILILGFVISFGHVFIQSNILKRYYGFPSVAVATLSESNEAGVATSSNELAAQVPLPNFIANNSFLAPMMRAGYDLLRVKNIRSVKSVLGLGSYIWIAFSIFLFIYALRKKNPTLLTLAILGLFLGFCTQTGILEMSNYRGRNGWYLMMLSVFSLVLFADQVYSKKMFRWLLPSCIILSATGFFWSPHYYRPYYDKEFEIVGQIAGQYPNKNINLITSEYQLGMVAGNITILDLKSDSLQNNNSILIIEKQIFNQDPVLSQVASSTDKNFIELNKKLEFRKAQIKDNIAQIELDENLKNFNKYFENNDFIVYENIKKE